MTTFEIAVVRYHSSRAGRFASIINQAGQGRYRAFQLLYLCDRLIDGYDAHGASVAKLSARRRDLDLGMRQLLDVEHPTSVTRMSKDAGFWLNKAFDLYRQDADPLLLRLLTHSEHHDDGSGRRANPTEDVALHQAFQRDQAMLGDQLTRFAELVDRSVAELELASQRETAAMEQYLWALAAIRITGIILALSILVWHLRQPLDRLRTAIRAVSNGEFAKLRIGSHTHEFEELISEFNAMTASLERDSEKRSELTRSLRRLSTRDALTGLYNRRTFEDTLSKERERAKRYGTALALLMFDVDHFKGYNDSFGHQAGDEALRSVGRIVSTAIRGSDIACRYGGEEFAVILPNADVDQASIVAEKLRRTIAEAPISSLDGTPLPSVTVSVGVTATNTNDVAVEELVARADEALYRAKEAGRNVIRVAEGKARVPSPAA
ncbi:MAG: diguanylate cyclase [Deltaproteobacteria bacterium]|nr:diguanylate cyclase [Deltaproteobacteria bacterium]